MNAISSHDKKVAAAIEAVRGRTLPATANMLSLAGIAWGVLGIGYGFFASSGGAAWTSGAILAASVYFLGLGQGGVVFAGIMTATQARWGRPLKRIGESFGFFLPVVWALLLIFLVAGGVNVYPWHPETFNPKGVIALAPHMEGVPHAKELWLQPGFFLARQAFGIGLLIALNFVFLRASLRPDLVAASKVLGADAPAWWSRFTGGAGSVAEEAEKGLATQYTMVPILGIAYAVLFSLMAFDLVMSLDPWWFSNMFGGWIFMSSLWLALAGIAAVTMLGRDWLGLGAFVKTSTTHDLGKLMLAGCMFWAYTLYAQILPIWYTNVPEETNFLLVRMFLPQWSWLSQVVAVTCFVAPFTILLSRGIKKMRWPFFAVAALIMTGLFLERSLLVMPDVYLGDAFPTLDFLIINVGIFAGYLGLFTQVVGRFLASVPAVPVSDFHLESHPWDVHVHSLDHH